MQRRAWLFLAVALIWTAAATYLFISNEPRRQVADVVRYPLSRIEAEPTLVRLDAYGGTGWTIPVDEQEGLRDVPLRHIYVVKLSPTDYRAYANIDRDSGCNIVWDRHDQQFVNPCHGQRYALDGTKLSGPGLMPGLAVLVSRAEENDLVIFPDVIGP